MDEEGGKGAVRFMLPLSCWGYGFGLSAPRSPLPMRMPGP